jgi:hypothetical protein
MKDVEAACSDDRRVSFAQLRGDAESHRPVHGRFYQYDRCANGARRYTLAKGVEVMPLAEMVDAK